MTLKDKSALITGAASGIGAGIARVFAAAGAKVCIADIDGEGAERAARELGAGAIAVRMDVTSEDEVERGVEEAARRLGGIDVLVSNAGVQHIDAIAELSFAHWKRLLAIHLDGGFLTTRACLRRMIAQRRGGSVILMGSVHSKEASVQKGPYVVAKHGLLGLARVVAKEGAPHGIRANVICPGFVRTPLVERQIPQLAKELSLSEQAVVRDVMLKNTVDGEFTTVDDVAQTALFLAAFPSNALTGQSIIVSHGWHME
ncbi:MAG TPA: 3-hydroxybutyrate dehydrogenase [Burkholderiales bacterium]|jgi:3-hydroxybutyrate dehydrogenase|nr:3-hydroxybutyrate dehydrogenase [Burkholderiales bacterium]